MSAIRREPTLTPTVQTEKKGTDRPMPGAVPAAIMPGKTVAARSLMLVVSLMSYLACLALVGVLIISEAVGTWRADIAREITLQIRPVSGTDIAKEIEKASQLLTETPGITGIRVISPSEAGKLLEPWLGKVAVISDLPIPRMIAIETDPDNSPDLVALETAIETQITGAELDTHQQWQAQLSRTADTLKWIGYGVLAIITLATAAVTVFATRSAIAANQTVVEVLHLVGARDGFIASQVQWHFVKLAGKAGFTGTLLGIASAALLALLGPDSMPGGLTDASRALIFGSPSMELHNYAFLVLIPISAMALSFITSRMTVMRILSDVL